MAVFSLKQAHFSVKVAGLNFEYYFPFAILGLRESRPFFSGPFLGILDFHQLILTGYIYFISTS